MQYHGTIKNGKYVKYHLQKITIVLPYLGYMVHVEYVPKTW